MPLTLLHDESGPVRIEVPLDGRTLFAQVWVAQVGRIPLLMLDSDVEQNAGYEREVTDRLYGGGTDHRLEQEVLLGMGGVRAIRAYCRITGAASPTVFHTNEGHAGFLGWSGSASTCKTAMTSIRHWNAVAPAPSSPLTPRFRPASTGSPARLIAHQFAGFPDLPLDRVLALGRRGLQGGDSQVQHGGDVLG